MLDVRARKRILQREEHIMQGLIQADLNEEEDYSLPGDRPLTETQKAEILSFWKKYEIMGPIDLRSFQIYYNRSGVCDPRYLPWYFGRRMLMPILAPEKYRTAFQNKAYLPKLLVNAKQPETVVRKVEGIYYNTAFQKIAPQEAAERCARELKNGQELVLKPSGRAGGEGIVFLQSASVEELRGLFRKKGRLFVVQKAIRQHPQMAALNPTTVNTVRLTTVLYRGQWIPVAALIKVGAPHMRVDNYKHGGCILGVNLDGSVLPWALNVQRERISTLPSGIRLGSGGFDRVPGFESVLETAQAAHYDIPRIKMVSWDIAVDETGEAEIIEANFGGDLRMHQVLTGPLLGEHTEKILDWYFLRNYSRKRMTRTFDYREYNDHIEINGYAGERAVVSVPETLVGKPVTVIGERAFALKQQLREVYLPDTVTVLRKQAFFGCPNLHMLHLQPDRLRAVGEFAVDQCPRLDEACRTQIITKRSGAPSVQKP